MAVPYTFGTATASIPLSQLDSNFATTITLGNTAIQLGNTVTTLNNMTLANVTVSSGNVTFTNVSATTANVTTANITTAVIGTATITTAGITTANVTTGNVTTLVTTSVTNSGLTTGRVVYTSTGGLETSSANLLYSGTDLTVYGLTVGRGAGAGATNTAVGVNALAAHTTSLNDNTAIGYNALATNSTARGLTAIGSGALGNATSNYSTALGYNAGTVNTTGNIVALGRDALLANTTGTNNVAVGYKSFQTNISGSSNTGIGYQAGNTVTGSGNQLFGFSAGSAITTGASNVILGAYTGSAAPISATGSNYVVLSDGDGNIVASTKAAQTFALPGGTLSTGAGIAFPASQSASTNANTLDDYEEGTWTPIDSSGAGLSFTGAAGTYTKIGLFCYITGTLTFPTTASAADATIGGLPFTPSSATNYNNLSPPVRNNKSLSMQIFGLNNTTFIFILLGNYTTYVSNVSLTAGTMQFSFAYQTA